MHSQHIATSQDSSTQHHGHLRKSEKILKDSFVSKVLGPIIDFAVVAIIDNAREFSLLLYSVYKVQVQQDSVAPCARYVVGNVGCGCRKMGEADLGI